MDTSDRDASEMDSLLANLSSGRESTRRRARESIVAFGKLAVAPLTALLTNPNEHVRWEAVKALGQIGGVEVALVLVNTLENELDSSIRWLAAEELIGLGHEGLAPLLQTLIYHSGLAWLRDGALLVIRSLRKKDPSLNGQVAAVLTALESRAPVIQVPPAAQAALDVLTIPEERMAELPALASVAEQ